MYICVYVYIYTHIYVYIQTYAHTRGHMHINAHSQELTHTVAILFIKVQVYIYVFGCFSTFMLFLTETYPYHTFSPPLTSANVSSTFVAVAFFISTFTELACGAHTLKPMPRPPGSKRAPMSSAASVLFECFVLFCVRTCVLCTRIKCVCVRVCVCACMRECVFVCENKGRTDRGCRIRIAYQQ